MGQAAAARAHFPARGVGIALHHGHLRQGKLHGLGHDLLQYGVRAGARVRGAGHERQCGVGVDAQRGTGRSERPGLAVVHADPAAHAGRFRLGPAGSPGRGFERFPAADVLPFVAQRRNVSFGQGVAQPELQRVQAEFRGDQVHVALDAEHDLRCPGRAHVSRRHGVRIGAQDLDLDVGHAVRPRGVHAAVHRVQRRERAVRAATEHERGLACDDPPVRGHAGTQRDDRGMPRISGQQLLGVGHDHLDRPARGRGQMIGGHAVHERALAAEVAADGGGVDADPRFVRADRRGELATRDERRLV